MRLATEEYLKCSEYPRVGVVIGREGRLLASGYRGEIEKKHAERIAMGKICREQLLGATLYTTLEPCVSLHEKQKVESCADLIVGSGITEVVIGVLDPNGTIYSQGYRRLLENNISVSFFSRRLRVAVEEETFEYGDIQKVFGGGRRRVPLVHSGIEMVVQFSPDDLRTIY